MSHPLLKGAAQMLRDAVAFYAPEASDPATLHRITWAGGTANPTGEIVGGTEVKIEVRGVVSERERDLLMSDTERDTGRLQVRTLENVLSEGDHVRILDAGAALYRVMKVQPSRIGGNVVSWLYFIDEVEYRRPS